MQQFRSSQPHASFVPVFDVKICTSRLIVLLSKVYLIEKVSLTNKSVWFGKLSSEYLFKLSCNDNHITTAAQQQ